MASAVRQTCTTGPPVCVQLTRGHYTQDSCRTPRLDLPLHPALNIQRGGWSACLPALLELCCVLTLCRMLTRLSSNAVDVANKGTLKYNVKSMHEIEIARDALDVETSLLGKGEFGEVRQGMWRKRNGDTAAVAVKVLKALKAETSAHEQKMFVKEGRQMVCFDHKHVVRLLGIVREGGFMLVTEFMRGGSLQKALRARVNRTPKLGLEKLSILLFFFGYHVRRR